MKTGDKFTQIEADDFKYRISRCADCGFTNGTDANTNGVTAIKAQLCAEIPTPFLCHFNAKNGEIQDGKEVLCTGFVETCNQLNAAGHYDNQPNWQRDLKLKIVDAISDIENQELPDAEAVELMNQRIAEFLQ